jgi:hypothetical protein
VLKKAAKKLGVSIYGYEFTSLDDDDITASVTMDVPPHRGSPFTKKQQFYGQWSKFGSEAKESACLTALTFLKDEGLIKVNDTSSTELKKYKQKFEEERFWSSMLYDRAFSLQGEVSGKATKTTPNDKPTVCKSSMTYFIEGPKVPYLKKNIIYNFHVFITFTRPSLLERMNQHHPPVP